MTSHIKSWSEASSEEHRKPNHAILLCKLHDTLFESGFISLSDTYEVIFSTNFDFSSQGISTDIRFMRPKQDLPDLKFLLAHRKKNNLTITQSRFF